MTVAVLQVRDRSTPRHTVRGFQARHLPPHEGEPASVLSGMGRGEYAVWNGAW